MNTALAKSENGKVPMTVRGLLESQAFAAKVAKALPKHLTVERFMRICNNTVLRTPKLQQCDPHSFSNALLLLSQYGLEPDGRRAHLIPFENKKAQRMELQCIIDWKGLAELVLRSGIIARLHADLICENDDFEFDMGDILHHRIDFRKDRGAPYAVYAMAITKTGERFVQVLQRSEVESVRNGSSGWQAFVKGYAKQSPWDEKNPVSVGEMWKKTAFRRLSKWLPLSPEIRDAVEMDDDDSSITPATGSAFAQMAQLPPSSTSPLVREVQEFEPESVDAVPQSDDETAEADAGLAPAPAPEKEKEKPAATKETTPQVQLCELCGEHGFTFDHLQHWGVESGNIPNADSLSRFSEIPTDVAKRILRSPVGLLQGLERAKGGGK